MIKEYKLDILIFFIFASIMMVFIIAQSSLFINNLSLGSPPQLWILLIAYFSVYKPPVPALLMIYLTSFFYSTLTSMSFGKMLFLSSILFTIPWFGKHLNLKNRKIFFIFCTSFTTLLPLLDWLISTMIPLQPIQHYPIFGWLLTIVNTSIAVLLLKPLIFHLDRWLESLRLPFEKRFLG
ncbi:MAG: hypothetical protein OXK80_05260 [Bdellovibrionales bacterium]|nr:hypothetical protein [Bdellovibrionales bacterium]